MTTQRHTMDGCAIAEVWEWYRQELAALAVPWVPRGYWAYGCFDNGVPIPKPVRALYRRRADLIAAFPEPFAADGSFLTWLHSERPELLLDAAAAG